MDELKSVEKELIINGNSVIMRFSQNETCDIKSKIIDILTAAYEDKIQNKITSMQS